MRKMKGTSVAKNMSYSGGHTGRASRVGRNYLCRVTYHWTLLSDIYNQSLLHLEFLFTLSALCWDFQMWLCHWQRIQMTNAWFLHPNTKVQGTERHSLLHSESAQMFSGSVLFSFTLLATFFEHFFSSRTKAGWDQRTHLSNFNVFILSSNQH